MRTYDILTETWRAPSVPRGETILFDEPGRVWDRKSAGGNYDVCYRAYHFRVTKCDGISTLRVKHGGGEEAWRLGSAMEHALATMSSDARFFVLHAIMCAHHESARREREFTAHEYREAFVEGRLRKRKVRGQAQVKVWIEPRAAVGAPA